MKHWQFYQVCPLFLLSVFLPIRRVFGQVSSDTIPTGFGTGGQTSCRWNFVSNDDYNDYYAVYDGAFTVPTKSLGINTNVERKIGTQDMTMLIFYPAYSYMSGGNLECSTYSMIYEFELGNGDPPTRTQTGYINPWFVDNWYGNGWSPSSSFGFTSSLMNVNGLSLVVFHGGKSSCASSTWRDDYTYVYDLQGNYWYRYSHIDEFGMRTNVPRNCWQHPSVTYGSYFLINCNASAVDLWITDLGSQVAQSNNYTIRWTRIHTTVNSATPETGGGRMELVADQKLVWMPRLPVGGGNTTGLVSLSGFARYYDARMLNVVNPKYPAPARLSFEALPNSDIANALQVSSFDLLKLTRRHQVLLIYNPMLTGTFHVFMYDLSTNTGFRPSINGIAPTARRFPAVSMYDDRMYVIGGVDMVYSGVHYLNCTGFIPESVVAKYNIPSALQFQSINYTNEVTSDPRFWGNILGGVLTACFGAVLFALYRMGKFKKVGMPQAKMPSWKKGTAAKKSKPAENTNLYSM